MTWKNLRQGKATVPHGKYTLTPPVPSKKKNTKRNNEKTTTAD